MQRAPGLPCALFFLGRSDLANLGHMLSRERERMSNVVAWIAPTGRANARLMTGSAKSGSSLPRISLRSIRATQITPGAMGPGVRRDDESHVPQKGVSHGPAQQKCNRMSLEQGLTSVRLHDPVIGAIAENEMSGLAGRRAKE